MVAISLCLPFRSFYLVSLSMAVYFSASLLATPSSVLQASFILSLRSQPLIVLSGSFSIIHFFLRSLKLISFYLLLPFGSFLPPHSSNIFLSSHFLFSTILLVFPPFSLLVFLSVFLVLYNNKNYNCDRKTILIAFV